MYQQMDGGYARHKVRYDSDNQVWTVVDVHDDKILTAKTTTSNPTTAAWKVGHQDDITLTVYHGGHLLPAMHGSLHKRSEAGLVPAVGVHTLVLQVLHPGKVALPARVEELGWVTFPDTNF